MLLLSTGAVSNADARTAAVILDNNSLHCTPLHSTPLPPTEIEKKTGEASSANINHSLDLLSRTPSNIVLLTVSSLPYHLNSSSRSSSFDRHCAKLRSNCGCFSGYSLDPAIRELEQTPYSSLIGQRQCVARIIQAVNSQGRRVGSRGSSTNAAKSI